MDLVDVDGRPVPVRGEDDRKADGDLGGRDDEDEDDEHAPALVDDPEPPRERDERQVRRVQHELDGHEDDDGVPPYEDSREPDEEEGRRHGDERAERHECRHSRRTSTIAPIIAARSRTDATSKGNAKSWNTLEARIVRSPPRGRRSAASRNENAMAMTGSAASAAITAPHGVCRWKKSPYARGAWGVNITP